VSEGKYKSGGGAGEEGRSKEKLESKAQLKGGME
jgi:hypothetical protein